MFVKKLFPYMQSMVSDMAHRWRKVTPTLILFPTDAELCPDGRPNPNSMTDGMALRTLLTTKDGVEYEEECKGYHGKAVIMNVCTPFLEAYPKDKPDCAEIYDLPEVRAEVVPETSEADLLRFLRERVQQSQPLKPFMASDVEKIYKFMVGYRKALNREGVKWRLAFNRLDASAVAEKLDRSHLDHLLLALGRRVGWATGELLYREDTFSPAYPFTVGDYLVMDVNPTTGGCKLNKYSLPLVRTVNGCAFETTYNVVPAPPPIDPTQPVGTLTNPISKKQLIEVVVPVLEKIRADGAYTWRKVAPVLILPPSDGERTSVAPTNPVAMSYGMPAELRSLLTRAPEETFQSAVRKCHGKNLMMTVNTPTLEVYPMATSHFEKTYYAAPPSAGKKAEESDAELVHSLQQGDEIHVGVTCDVTKLPIIGPRYHLVGQNFDLTSVEFEKLAAHEKARFVRAPATKPLAPIASDFAKVGAMMVAYRKALNREGVPWRLAFKNGHVVVALKLEVKDLEPILTAMGRPAPAYPTREKLYLEGTELLPRQPFTDGDYVLMDLSVGTFAFDAEGRPLVRIVNGAVFEATYNKYIPYPHLP